MLEKPTVPRFDERKTTEEASIFLQLGGGKMKYIKLLKLLYLADRKALEEWERPITNDSYVNMDKGPVVSSAYDLVKGGNSESGYWNKFIETIGFFVQLKSEPPKISKLSRAEIKLIHEIFEEFGPMRPFELVGFAHTLPEYKDPQGTSVKIPLEELLGVLRYDSDDIERISSELNEEAYIDSLFGD